MKNKNKVLNRVTKSLRKSQACTLAVEEISELITEISLVLAGEGNYDDLCEEVADVNIMTGLIMNTFKIKSSDIKKAKKLARPAFTNYMKNHDKEFNLKSCVYELAKFQKVICKKVRGRHNKKDIIDSIVAVELSIEFLASKNFIKDKDCKNWEKKKIEKMQKRIRKNQIV